MLDLLQRRLREEGSITITVHARPGARQSKIVGQLADGTLKIDLHAAPEGGRANIELAIMLGKEFAVPPGNIAVLSGRAARRKLVRVSALRAAP